MPFFKVITRLYKKGLSGLQSFALATGTPISVLALPDIVLTILSPSFTCIVTCAFVAVVFITSFTTDLSTSGVIFIDAMFALGKGSNQTVCHIPVTEVYIMPCGLRVCLPRGWPPLSVGSYTRKAISCSPALVSAPVIS